MITITITYKKFVPTDSRVRHDTDILETRNHMCQAINIWWLYHCVVSFHICYRLFCLIYLDHWINWITLLDWCW